MAISNPQILNIAGLRSRLRVADITKTKGPIPVNGSSLIVGHEYGFSLVQCVVSNPTGAGVAGTTTVAVLGSLNGQDFEVIGTITITGAAGQGRVAGHTILSGVWPFIYFVVTAVGTAGSVVDGYAQPVAGNLN